MLLGIIQIILTLSIVILIVPFLGQYMANVFLEKPTKLDKIFLPIETFITRFIGINYHQEMTGWQYARSLLYFNLIMGIFVFILIQFQANLPLNFTNLPNPSWDLVLHTSISFLTNTDQQHYSGETTLTYSSQILGLGFLMFTSAASGLTVGIAFIRGLTGRNLGNFYIDFTRAIIRILLPISLISALMLLIAGVPETLSQPISITTLEGNNQTIATGAVAHWEAIKQLGENGGGFFGVNSAHPYENPNTFTNLIEIILMLVIPTSLIYTYGIFADNKKQGWLLFGMVFIIFLTLVIITAIGEYNGNPLVNQIVGENLPNLEGKETRFGCVQTALWAVTTTATMCGAVNGMHDSLMPTGGFTTLSNLFLQVIWGGQGTGTAYLFVFLILTVFLTGLMVGRTPEFLGRKIEKREIVLGSVILLVHPITVLIPSAITLAFSDNLGGISNPSFHGISQVVYEYTSAAANNGSGFEGLGDNTLWWNLSTSLVLLIARYLPIIALLLLADGMYNKKPVPETTGTLRTDTFLFTSITGGIIIILGALTFFPVLALGPIAEHFLLH